MVNCQSQLICAFLFVLRNSVANTHMNLELVLLRCLNIWITTHTMCLQIFFFEVNICQAKVNFKDYHCTTDHSIHRPYGNGNDVIVPVSLSNVLLQ